MITAAWKGTCPHCGQGIGGTRKFSRESKVTTYRRCPNRTCDRVVKVRLFQLTDRWKVEITPIKTRYD